MIYVTFALRAGTRNSIGQLLRDLTHTHYPYINNKYIYIAPIVKYSRRFTILLIKILQIE